MTVSVIKFSEDIQKRIDAGELLTLAVLFYVPETDELRFYVPPTMSREEALAMLRKFGYFLPLEL